MKKEKKYLVIKVYEDYGKIEGFEVITNFYTKEELYRNYYNYYVKLDVDGGWTEVESKEDAYETLMEEFENCATVEFIERHGEEHFEKWKEAVKDRICHLMSADVMIYEIYENGMLEIFD